MQKKIIQQWLDIPEKNTDGEFEFGVFQEIAVDDGWEAAQILKVTAADAETARQIRDLLLEHFHSEIQEAKNGARKSKNKLQRIKAS